MGNEISTEIIDMELYQAKKEMNEMTEEEFTDYSDVSQMTEDIQENTENLVKSQKIPDKSIINQVSVTDMVIDLAMASLAKQTSVKIQRLESFLGKIEDRLFKDDALDNMSKADLAALYTSTRMMRTDAFRMLKEIKSGTDFKSLEADLLSLHSKEAMKDTKDGDEIKGILQSLLTDDSFIDAASELQRNKLNKDKKE